MSVTQTIEIVFHRRCLMFNRVLNLFVDGVLFSLVSEAGTRWCSVRKLFLEISQNSQENNCVGVSFLMKSYKPEACKFIKKETPTQVLSFEFCEVFKNTFFCKTPLVAASVAFISGDFINNYLANRG